MAIPIQIDSDKVAVISREDIHEIANLLDEIAITTDDFQTRGKACERVSALLHQLYLGTRTALMLSNTFETHKDANR